MRTEIVTIKESSELSRLQSENSRLKAERERVIELLRDATGYNATGYPYPDKLKKEIAVVLSKPILKQKDGE